MLLAECSRINIRSSTIKGTTLEDDMIQCVHKTSDVSLAAMFQGMFYLYSTCINGGKQGIEVNSLLKQEIHDTFEVDPNIYLQNVAIEIN